MNTKQQLFASRATEKASAALFVLAAGEGTLADRLTRAWDEEFGMLSDKPLPGEFQERFDHMRELVTAEGASATSGQFENSIRAMSHEDAHELAREIVRFAMDVEIATAERQ